MYFARGLLRNQGAALSAHCDSQVFCWGMVCFFSVFLGVEDEINIFWTQVGGCAVIDT
jgi:hypothetical protein